METARHFGLGIVYTWYIGVITVGNTGTLYSCDSPCERTGKWEIRPILKEDRSLVGVQLEEPRH
jgi:hypothetical protein